MRDQQPGGRLNIVDRAVSFFNPIAGARRLAARQVLHKFGAHPERRGSSGGRGKNASSESPFKHRNRVEDMWNARDMAEYDWIGGTLARVILYTCGELTAKSRTGDPSLDRAYDEYFHDWCGDEEDDDGLYRCDLTGRHRFLKIVQMALLAMFVDGDHLLYATVDPDPEIPEEQKDIQLQMIEADRLGRVDIARQSEGEIGGVKIDPATGRPQKYEVYERTREGQYVNPRDLDAVQCLHLWDPNRSDKYRGTTILRSILDDARDIREWSEGEMVAGKTQTQWSALVGSRDPFATNGAGKWEGKTAQGTPTQEALWGKILRVAEGESFSMVSPPSRPSGAFMSFLQWKIRRMSVCLDLSYGFLWDLSMLGGVTARIEVRHDERRITYWQRLLVDRILRRVRHMVLSRAVALDHLPFHPLMRKCDWHFGPYIVTDVGYEAQNDLAMAKAGILSLPSVASKYDADMVENARANAGVINELRALSAETGVPIEMLAAELFPQGTALLASAASPPAPPPAPGSLEAVGEKGAAQIVDLLSKVSTGQMEREAAKQTLVTVYGLTPAKAEQITPAEPVRRDPMEPPDEDAS